MLAAAAALAVVAALATPAGRSAGAADGAKAAFRSPQDLAYSPDGKRLAVTDHTAGAVALISPATGQVIRQVPLKGAPAGLAFSPDGEKLYVAEEGAGSVAEIDAAGRVVRRLAVGTYPAGLAVTPDGKRQLAACWGRGSLVVIDLASGREQARIPMLAQPRSVAVTAGGKLAVVGNLLPAGDARDPTHAAAVSVVDLVSLKRIADVRLPGGSTQLRDVAVSPDGRWAYAVHTVGRFTLPTTQLERGWVNTNALSVVRLAGAGEPGTGNGELGEKKKVAELYATVLLDHVAEGAADPWGIALSGDGKTLWVTLAGVHQVARVDLDRLHRLLAGRFDGPLRPALEALRKSRQAGVQVTWLDIKADGANRARLVNDLTAMHLGGVLKRWPLPGKGPRGIDVSPDGKALAVGMYFSGAVLTVSAGDGKVARTISLGPQGEADQARRGERIFHDATYSFQHWLSCASCHPDARADGLNWDLLNDGLGNAKNAKSLLWSHRTPPVMARGIRASMAVATRSGFRFILFRVPADDEAEAVEAYLRSLKPAPSPYLVDGRLSLAARRGKAVFNSPQAACATCHPARLFTDLKSYDVGTRGKRDRAADFDTPTTVELWRSAPYLHDGSAATMTDVLTTHNRTDKHGHTSKLTKRELQDLTEYLLSL